MWPTHFFKIYSKLKFLEDLVSEEDNTMRVAVSGTDIFSLDVDVNVLGYVSTTRFRGLATGGSWQVRTNWPWASLTRVLSARGLETQLRTLGALLRIALPFGAPAPAR